MYDIILFQVANHEIRHKATYELACQSGDCEWPLQSSCDVCVDMYGLTYSIYHPRRCWFQGIFSMKTSHGMTMYKKTPLNQLRIHMCTKGLQTSNS